MSPLVIVIGLCCVVSAVVNILHSQRSPEMTALEATLNDFREGRPPLTQAQKEHIQKENHEQAVKVPLLMKQEDADSDASDFAHLSCTEFGGPDDEFAQEMVYWKDIPSDSHYVSPFHVKKGQQKRYMTFEPDGGGWNNIRMAMETVLGLGKSFAFALQEFAC